MTINTGAGKDVLSINSMVGKMESTYNKEDYLVADLGADGNMLSMGAALGVEQARESLVAGVVFDNTGGAGRVCFLKGDFKSTRCVGTVKQVTIFKGSRLGHESGGGGGGGQGSGKALPQIQNLTL